MILANIPLPRSVSGKGSGVSASRPRIDTSSFEVPLGATCWIGCLYAWPHIDTMWRGELFLTLSVLSDHDAGDALAPDPHAPVPRGTLFVVDPMTRHWLQRSDAHNCTRHKQWVGLQWEVKRGKAKEKARQIVKELGGVWMDCDDKRYAGWAVPQ